jgi:hypothetical protein
MTGSPEHHAATPQPHLEIRAIFEEACERRRISQDSPTAHELAKLMLNGHANGLRDRQGFYALADIHP